MVAEDQVPAEADVRSPITSAKRKPVQEIEIDLSAPEPPSKRARRALKKGKALPTKPDSDREDDADGDNKNSKDKPRSEHGIWVGNLPFYLTAAHLRKWLVDNAGGVIVDESITRIKLPTTKEPGRDKSQKPANRGFAYVDFADVGAKVAAIALSETDLGGRRLLIKDAKSFQGRPAKEKEPAGAAAGKPQGKAEQKKDANASRKLFVGNMSFKTTEDDLRRNFEKCGDIEWVKMATFEDTGKCKGFGWVKFKEPESAAWAVKGFVKMKQKVETEDDFDHDAGDDKDGETEEQPKQKQFETRKWWVNRLLGRELKLELAEDDQTRYKKRFGKDAPKRHGDEGRPRAAEPREGEGQAGGAVLMPLKEASDIQVARLTAAVVKHTGTKVTFD